MPKSRVSFLLLVAIFLIPVIAAYIAFFYFPPTGRVNYGRLITPPVPLTAERFVHPQGHPVPLSDLQGKWVLLTLSDDSAALSADRYAMRQARSIQGREQGRILRMVLGRSGVPQAGDEDVHGRASPELAAQLDRLASDRNTVFILDPLGNLMMAYEGEIDIKKMAKDLKRLLQTSRIG